MTDLMQPDAVRDHVEVDMRRPAGAAGGRGHRGARGRQGAAPTRVEPAATALTVQLANRKPNRAVSVNSRAG